MLYQAVFLQHSGHEPYVLLLTMMFTNNYWAWISFLYLAIQEDGGHAL